MTTSRKAESCCKRLWILGDARCYALGFPTAKASKSRTPPAIHTLDIRAELGPLSRYDLGVKYCKFCCIYDVVAIIAIKCSHLDSSWPTLDMSYRPSGSLRTQRPRCAMVAVFRGPIDWCADAQQI